MLFGSWSTTPLQDLRFLAQSSREDLQCNVNFKKKSLSLTNKFLGILFVWNKAHGEVLTLLKPVL